MIEVLFFFEVVLAGLLAGTMYSLVALGFVLIYKASSTFNFAQGAMVFFAVLSFVGFMELGIPFAIAFAMTVILMIAVGYTTERLVLQPLRNESEDRQPWPVRQRTGCDGGRGGSLPDRDLGADVQIHQNGPWPARRGG
jgi:hypothetical protein